MYVCLCNGVTDGAIEEAAHRGVRTFRELSFSTGCGTQCGTCVKTAREILKTANSELSNSELSVVHQGLSAA